VRKSLYGRRKPKGVSGIGARVSTPQRAIFAETLWDAPICGRPVRRAARSMSRIAHRVASAGAAKIGSVAAATIM